MENKNLLDHKQIICLSPSFSQSVIFFFDGSNSFYVSCTLGEVKIVLYFCNCWAVVRGKLGMENRLHQKKSIVFINRYRWYKTVNKRTDAFYILGLIAACLILMFILVFKMVYYVLKVSSRMSMLHTLCLVISEKELG